MRRAAMIATETGWTCPQCRGALVMADLGHICPICGARLADALDLKAIDTATGLIAADVACVRCQYNLRTIPIGSVCPECGTPAVQSLTRDELRWAKPEWVQKTAQGLGILAFAQAWTLVAETCSWLGPRLITPSDLATAWLISGVLAIVGIGTLGWGSFAITHRERPDARVSLMLRNQILRFCVIVMAVTCAMMWLYPFAQYAWSSGWAAMARSNLRTVLGSTRTSPSMLHLGLWLMYAMASLAAVFSLTMVLRGLAVRAGRTGVRKAMAVVLGLWVIDGTANLVMISLLFEMYTRPRVASSVYTSYQIGSCARQAGSLALAIILFVACLRLRKRFRGVLQGRMGSSPA